MDRRHSIFGWQIGRIFRLLPLLVGTALSLYVGAQYGMMSWEQRRLENEWKKQTDRSQIALPSAPPDAMNGLTHLQIPRINLDAMVVEGTHRRQLAVAPGHMIATPAPGDAGNAVITAHRDTFFRHIHELQKGDTILVQRDGKTFTFAVTGKKIVEPDDLSVIQPSQDVRLTLITCYPTYYIGPAPERLVVFSTLKSGPASAGDSPSAAKAAVIGSGSAN